MSSVTWQWYSLMDAALQGQHAINPPMVVSQCHTRWHGQHPGLYLYCRGRGRRGHETGEEDRKKEKERERERVN